MYMITYTDIDIDGYMPTCISRPWKISASVASSSIRRAWRDETGSSGTYPTYMHEGPQNFAMTEGPSGWPSSGEGGHCIGGSCFPGATFGANQESQFDDPSIEPKLHGTLNRG